MNKEMSFTDALKILNIEDYADRIFHSNSHGELFHLQQYFHLANTLKGKTEGFREWFVAIVGEAENKWQRPESVFQHITTILIEHLQHRISSKNK